MDPEVAFRILRGSSCRGSTPPRDPARISGISCIVGRFLTAEPPGRGWLAMFIVSLAVDTWVSLSIY